MVSIHAHATPTLCVLGFFGVLGLCCFFWVLGLCWVFGFWAYVGFFGFWADWVFGFWAYVGFLGFGLMLGFWVLGLLGFWVLGLGLPRLTVPQNCLAGAWWEIMG